MKTDFFEYRLVPCELGAQPMLRRVPDLTQNVEVAQAILDRIETFFCFQDGWPILSGYARRADRNDGGNPLLYVQMVDGSGVYRSFAFRGLGFVGVVYIEEPEGGVSHFCDHLFAIAYGFMQEGPSIADDWESSTLGLVEEGRLAVWIP